MVLKQHKPTENRRRDFDMHDAYTDEFNGDLDECKPRCNEGSYSTESIKTGCRGLSLDII